MELSNVIVNNNFILIIQIVDVLNICFYESMVNNQIISKYGLEQIMILSSNYQMNIHFHIMNQHSRLTIHNGK